MGRVVEQRVVPFYLEMMGENAARADDRLLAAVRESGRQVTLKEVTRLLRDDWRPRVMGAWYAVVLDSRALREVLSASLVSSAGSLTAPPLAAAATALLGADAIPALEAYAGGASANSYLGSEGFVAACIERLGGDPSRPASDDERHAVQGLLAAAHKLRQP